MKDFQTKIAAWAVECFGLQTAADKPERNARFLEEALELVQAGGFTREAAHQLVDYTFSRPVGEAHQEVGGVMVTLAAWCAAFGVSLTDATRTETLRIHLPHVVEKIRAKNANKPKFGPLPGAAPAELVDFEILDTWCSACFERQFKSPGGPVCQNGHGGADGLTHLEMLSAKTASPAAEVREHSTPALAALAQFRRSRS